MEIVENFEINYLISFTSVEIAESFKSLYAKKFIFNNGFYIIIMMSIGLKMIKIIQFSINLLV